MNKNLYLIIVALATFALVLYIKRPDIISKFGLWAVGLSGFIIKAIQILQNFFTSKIDKGAQIIKNQLHKNTK